MASASWPRAVVTGSSPTPIARPAWHATSLVQHVTAPSRRAWLVPTPAHCCLTKIASLPAESAGIPPTTARAANAPKTVSRAKTARTSAPGALPGNGSLIFRPRAAIALTPAPLAISNTPQQTCVKSATTRAELVHFLVLTNASGATKTHF